MWLNIGFISWTSVSWVTQHCLTNVLKLELDLTPWFNLLSIWIQVAKYRGDLYVRRRAKYHLVMLKQHPSNSL